MNHIYYVQKQSEYYRKMIVPLEKDFTVHEDFAFGILKEEWINEFKKLHLLMKSIYEDICNDPASYGLPLYEVKKYHYHSKEARESLSSIWRVGNILYCLSMCGEIVNGNLLVNNKEFDRMIADMKIKNKAAIINKLIERGFCFSNWDGKRFSKGCNEFIVSYQDTVNFFAMLKGYCLRASYSLKGTKGYVNTHFYVLNYKIVEENSEKLPEFHLSHFENLIGEENTKFFKVFLEHIQKYNYSIRIEEDIIFKAVFLNSKGKDTKEYFQLTDYHYPQDGLLKLRLKLDNIAQYIHKYQWTEDIKEAFKNANPCRHCKEKCTRRVSFMIDGMQKDACVWEGDVFSFFSPKIEDLSYYKTLFDLERESIKRE